MEITDFHQVELPREKFEKHGPRKLQDHEILAILLGSGIRGMSVFELSKKVMEKIEDIPLEQVTLEDLFDIKGLGKAKAILILAAIEFDRRMHTEVPEVLSPFDVWNLCGDIRDSKREHMIAFYIDAQNRLIGQQTIQSAIPRASHACSKEIFEPAVRLCASGVVLARNHPSGKLEPTEEDMQMTRRIMEAGNILGAEVLDFIILSKDQFVSFKQKGMI